ncbi:MAG: hypothetical protein EPN70_17525 [Paraburkholderia sp.]|uniref:hypothetical protein n=1 Tax=Paraburkholderia sp. TaxID=1926495 RepID=UPI001215F1DD|nr:hypothetical protein [Paraburkholderia sp.]TAM02181.1 MAG: hypothetical protein EPN70_17525 [Paraburkholderia sp.]TAM28131.1 MAG: hypothetical protein EPN59_18395 [Paraburkholderia sp.]
MSEQSYLEQSFPRFSEPVVTAAREGRLDAAPLVDVLERALIVASGVAAVLQLETVNIVRGEVSTPDDGLESPLSSGIMHRLLELARVSAESLERDIERVADWADKCCAPEGKG